jgi:hypothetical protein
MLLKRVLITLLKTTCKCFQVRYALRARVQCSNKKQTYKLKEKNSDFSVSGGAKK